MIGKKEMLKERVELLGIGEGMGYPRLGYGNKAGKRLFIPAGQREWERFCNHGHTTRIIPAIRNARILNANGVVPFHPPSLKEIATIRQAYEEFLKVDLMADFEEVAAIALEAVDFGQAAVVIDEAPQVVGTVTLKTRNAKNRGSRLKPSKNGRLMRAERTQQP